VVQVERRRVIALEQGDWCCVVANSDGGELFATLQTSNMTTAISSSTLTWKNLSKCRPVSSVTF
jgi:hypothetical protein